MATTTFRADIVAGHLAILTAFSAAHPTLLPAVHARRPAKWSDMPCAFLELSPEVINWDSGLRVRVMSPDVVVATWLSENIETMALMDQLADELVEAYSVVEGRIAAGTVFSRMSITDAQEEHGERGEPGYAVLQTLRLGFPDVSVQEGRN